MTPEQFFSQYGWHYLAAGLLVAIVWRTVVEKKPVPLIFLVLITFAWPLILTLMALTALKI